ncbi:Peptidylprolyl isomerase [Mycena indigotica]|uniref:peptidylprolyl isomerase n=1 Tax=Mycena indigotica TaxID=2126181 RepID=A0A8H6TE10_9AGAR|nr:Peptidylprolyl isomerase [Mycena indigotica]KAF7315559.1 Peptidylprolyl isomerase [Mycena indigotica]
MPTRRLLSKLSVPSSSHARLLRVLMLNILLSKVYLTGNYIEMQNQNMPPFGSELDSEEEEDFDLREVSSDVEMDADELDDEARFEEIDDAVHGAKRPRESDAAAEKTSKKQKSETGQAVKPASEKKDKKDKKKDKSQDQDKKPDEKKSEGASKAVEREIAGGIKIKDSKVGTGPAAKKGNSVSMRYVGRLSTPQGKIFDSNTKGKPFNFQLGKGEVIKGWDEGIVGMQVGGERLLTLPPNMGYGKRGTDGIPGNSTLVFEVKLVSINK